MQRSTGRMSQAVGIEGAMHSGRKTTEVFVEHKENMYDLGWYRMWLVQEIIDEQLWEDFS